MAFRPRMQVQTHSYRAVRPLRVRTWPGVVADVWRVQGQSGAGGFYISPDARLVVFLDGAPRSMSFRTNESGNAVRGVSMLYIPAGQPLWSHLQEDEDFGHLDFHLQAGPLTQRLAGLATPSTLSSTLIRDGAGSATARSLAAMVANEVEHPSRPAMMLDGLLSALLADVFDLSCETDAPGRGLSRRQMAAITKHVRRVFPERVSVGELAALCGYSESWFARAFRHSNGETPQRWMTRLRLEAALDLMTSTNLGLAEIADATGFADQAHLTRIFHSVHGLPPSQWRRSRAEQANSQKATRSHEI